MGAANFVQTAFDGGEWSPYAQGQFEDPKYRSSLAVCQNMVPIETHALVRRPGFQYANTTRNGAYGRLIEFSFENNIPHTMEFTDSHMRAFEGPRLLTNQEVITVTTISTATPAAVTLSAAVTWTTGTQVQFAYGSLADQSLVPYLSNRVFAITVVDSTHFTLSDPVTDQSIDGSLIAWTGSPTITVSSVIDLATPYAAADLPLVRPVQNETNMLLLHGSYAPQELQASNNTDTSPATFSINPISFIDGPYLDPINGSTITPDATSGTVNLTLSAQVYSATTGYSNGDYVLSSGVTYISLQDNNVGNTPASSPTFWSVTSPGAVVGPAGFTNADIGRHIRIYSEPPLWASATTYAVGDQVTFDNQHWSALVAMTGATPTFPAINPNQPGVKSTTWQLTPTSAVWSWGKVTGIPTTGFIDPNTAASKIGNMTTTNGTVKNGVGAGLAAAFDGITNQTAAASAALQQTASSMDAYVGLHFTSGTTLSSAVVYPSNDNGFGYYVTTSKQNFGSMTFKLRGKNSAPSSASDGTVLSATTTIHNSHDTRSAITLVSNDTTTTYTYVWVEMFQSGASEPLTMLCAECQFTGGGAAVGGSVVTIELLGPPLLFTTAARVWRLGLYTTNGPVWPSCGCYHEGRLWLGGAVANRFDATTSNGFGTSLTFSPTESDGTVSDSSGISYTLNSSDLNAIYWMIPDIQGIIMGTIGGEWLVDAPDTPGGFTPTNIRGRRVTKYGAANIEPRKTGLTTVFVQRYQRKLLEYVADAFSGKLLAPNLAKNVRAIVQPGIAEIAYQQEENPIVWCRGTDGSLFAVSYKRTSLLTSQPAELIGWHRHPLGSGRLVESLCLGPTADGLLESLSIITNDPATGVRHVEVMRNFFEEDDDVMTTWQLDDAIVPTAITTSGTNVVLSGLHHLNGQTVRVFIAGLDLGTYQVIADVVTVPYGGLFTKRWLEMLQSLQLDFGDMDCPVDSLQATVPALVGFGFSSRGQLLRPIAQDQTGARTGPAFGKYRRIGKYYALVHNAQDLQLGTDFDHMHSANFRSPGEGRDFTPPALYSGIHWDTMDDTDGMDGQICWEVSDAYPLAIMAIGGEIETVD